MPGHLKVGIVGVGSIGQTVATALDQGRVDAQLVAISDQDVEKAKAFVAKLGSRPPVVSLDELLDRARLVALRGQRGEELEIRHGPESVGLLSSDSSNKP